MSVARPEKFGCPFAVVRVDVESLDAANPEWSITVVALFDDEASATAEAVRLQALNADKRCVYFKQRVKKYFRIAHGVD